jgi:hypothetical protein
METSGLLFVFWQELDTHTATAIFLKLVGDA